MKKIKSLIILTALIFAAKSNAGSFSGPFTIVDQPFYINYCQNEIFVEPQGMLSGAMVQFNLTEETLTNVLYIPLNQTIETLLFNTAQTTINTFNKLNSDLVKIKLEESDTRMEQQKRINDDRIKEKLIIDKALAQQDKQLFLGESDDLEKEYFRQLCNDNKVRESMQSPKAKEKATLKVAVQVDSMIRKQKNATSVTSSMKDSVDRSRERYCSQAEFESGLCDAISEIPNGDINAAIFLNPVGNSDPLDITNNTNYTYNEIESQVANDFINNVVGIFPINSPTIDESNDPRMQDFVGMYNMSLSAITLVRQVLQEAYERRVPISNHEKSKSYLDYLDSQINDIMSNKNMLLFANTSESGKKAKLVSAMAVNNKLSLEMYALSEKSKLLDATLLSLKENSPSNLIYMKTRK